MSPGNDAAHPGRGGRADDVRAEQAQGHSNSPHVRGGLPRAYPVTIDEAELPPHLVIREVAQAVRDCYPGELWKVKGRPVRLDLENGALVPLTDKTFRALVPSAANLRGRGGGKARVQRQVADDVFNHPASFQELRGVRYAPWVDEEGRLVAAPGLDEKTGIYLHWAEAPCTGQATDAEVSDVLNRLLDLSFADEASRGNYLSMLLRSVRHLQGKASPMSVISADDHTSGKSYAAELLGLVSLGRLPELHTLPEDPRERKYTLDMFVAQEPALLWLDNVATGSLVGGQELNAVATANGPKSGRKVQSSDTIAGDPTLVHFVLTGNSLSYDAEQARRVLLVNLKPRPDYLPFRTQDLKRWALENRRLVLNVLLRLVLLWHEAGRPAPPRALDSFEGWSKLVGGPVCHLRPVTSRLWLSEASRPVGAEERELTTLFEAWPLDEQGARRVLSANAVLGLARSRDLALLSRRAGAGSNQSQTTTFGGWLTTLTRRQRSILGWYLRVGTVPPKGHRGYVPTRVPQPPHPGPGEAGGPEGAPGAPLPNLPNLPNLGGEENREEVVGGGIEETSGRSGKVRLVHVLAPPNHPTEGGGPGEVRLAYVPEGAPEVIHAMAQRGLPLDPHQWRTLGDAAVAELLVDDTDRSKDRLEALHNYLGGAYTQALSGDGRVRAEWYEQGPGRWSCKEPHLHQVTKSYRLREAVRPEGGRVFVRGDWWCAHFWVAAGLAGDSTLLEHLLGGQLYEEAAEQLGCTRDVAKVALLSLLNGEGAGKLAEQLGVSRSEARRRRTAWWRSYPELDAYVRGLPTLPRAFTTPRGRTVDVPPDVGEHALGAWRWQAYEADALTDTLERVERWPCVFVFYDEVLLEVPAEDAAQAQQDLKEAMSGALMEAANLPYMESARVDVRSAWQEPKQ